MLPLIIRTIYIKRKSLLIYIIICALMVWMFVAFFPTMYEQAEVLSEAFASYPESFLKAFGIDEIESLFLTLESFLAAEYYSMMWPLTFIIFFTSLGVSSIAGEIENGTIEILLVQPISRAKIYFGKFIAGLFILLMFIIVSNFSVIPFALLHNVEINLQSYFVVSILGLLFSLAIFSSAMMFSAMFSSKGRSGSLTAGMLVLMYAINLIATFKESVQNLKYLSFFYYYDFNAALINHKIDLLSIGVFLGFSLVCSLIGLVVFFKRDIAT